MKKLLLFIALTIFGLGLNAQNVGDVTTIDYDGYSLEFTITSVEPAKCKVSGRTGNPVDVTIPSTVEISGNDFSITSIGSSAFSSCSSLISIEIPNSVTSIGYHAFYFCSSLTSIEIPNTVTSIGEGAFYYCESLTGIEIPNSVTSIGEYAFSECSSLTSIEIPNSVTSIGSGALRCSSLTSIVVAEGNTVYDSRENCNAIIETSSNKLIAGCQNTVIPNSVTSIGERAFYDCSSLTSIEIPNSVTSIGDYAFYYCSSLISITFEENSQLTSIGGGAFYDCSSLTSIEIPNSVTSIGSGAFRDCSSLTSIEIPNSVTSIGDNAFSDCSSLTSIEIPNSVTSIGWYAFSECSSLTSVIFEENSQLTVINPMTFYDCDGLTSIEIPNSVTIIGYEAFKNCLSLTSIEIPNSVTAIGRDAFNGCSALEVIKCYAENVPETKDGVFSYCPLGMIIYVPANSVEEYKATSPWYIYNIMEIGGVGYYNVVNYGDYSLKFIITNTETAECEVVCNTKPTGSISITIPSSVEIEGTEFTVTSIGKNAFYYCSRLTSIEIPNSVTSIGDKAFYTCSSLTSITFGDNPQLTSIGNDAFLGCVSLTSIEIPNSVTSIGSSAFSFCSRLTSIEIPNSVTSIGSSAFSFCSLLTSIEIPNSVTSIGESAFYYCSRLTSIEIPNSVTSIGESAFSYCKNLTSIVVAEGNTVYDSRENCNAIIETSSNTLIAGCQNTVIPNSVASIGNYAFYGCLSLTSIEIPATIKSIGEHAFASTSLRIINMEDFNQLSNIAESAFSGCSSLEMVVLPKYISSISESAFERCSSLKGINIPEYVTEIGSSAFSGCSNLNSVKCYATSVPTSPEDIFDSVPSNMTIQVPGASMASYLVAAPWKNYILTPGFSHQITVVSNNSELGTVTGSGTYDEGVVVTLTATVNGNNEFDCWTEDGVIVSKETTYVFNATRDRVIIGNFRTDDTPQNVVAKAIDSQSIELTWNAIATASSYNVYRDGELLKNVNTNSYLDEGLEAETKYCYTITTVSASGEESEKSTEACAKTMKENSEEPEDPEESIEELSSSINIYPNPVENDLFIATEMNVKEVAIYDVYGRQTMSLQVNETTSQQVVEVADLEAGVYFVKVVTNAGEIVKRFVKK